MLFLTNHIGIFMRSDFLWFEVEFWLDDLGIYGCFYENSEFIALFILSQFPCQICFEIYYALDYLELWCKVYVLIDKMVMGP